MSSHGSYQTCLASTSGPQEIATHCLNIKANTKLVQQCLHRIDKEKRKAIGEELAKLLVTGLIKEVQHPDWLANPVLVKKRNGKWRMHVDYTGLNKACPNDLFPFLRLTRWSIPLSVARLSAF